MYRAKPADGIAWVTGASSGIGRAVALELARRGYVVAATARRAEELATVALAAAGSPGRIVAYPGDVTDLARMGALVAEIEAALGPIALAFLNAGTYYPDAQGLLDPGNIMKTYAVNVGGTVHCLAPVVASMEGRRTGQIAITSSVAGYGGLPKSIAYGSTKAALINMAQALKFHLDPFGITLQVVNPGFVKTPLTDRNDFPMPFLVEVDDAAQRICDGFERGGFEITFPRRLSLILKALQWLPYPAYFWLVSKGTGSAGR